ncbi:hypothetical protein EV384_6349 [Micromonospora kangleipakensis]|uniref:Uncharacterized protein n=1 Tax=Micromonospora kangleipakensis TaxID=1077942 RepID=A0A4Q8BID7_9ACTN|nr:hypothetical protein [Micromonospora kangleipakensis]RZU77618.1 hypothetical protein EV384_6349 [Micromonospora kangleipakensis]
MATTKKPTSNSAAASKAKKDRIAAEQKHTETVQAHADAQAKLASLHEALAGGDASITSEALAMAEQEITRTRLLADAASKALAEALEIERQAVATQAAEELPERFAAGTRTREAAEAQAQAAVTSALTALLRVVDQDNQAIRQAVGDARAARLIDGQCDPLCPVIAGRERVGFTSRVRDYIEVYGERYAEASPAPSVETVLRKALDAAGVNLTIAHK